MASELPLYEAEINSLIKEYLSYAGLDKSSYSLVLECKERGKIISTENRDQGDGFKLTAQNNLLLEFDSGNYSSFWSLWDEHIPEDIRHRDQTCRRLEFYIQIHFAVFPIRIGRASLTGGSLEQSMTLFKDYLENKGSNLSQTTEFLPFYALPFVPNPVQHPSFKEIFSNYWVPDLRGRVEKFLYAALSVSEPPLLITLVKNKRRLEVAENASEQDTKHLQQNLIQAEKRCSAYMKRFNKLQTDYHTLISITAELVDSLEQTVQGKMVTVEYLQQVCARLFNNRATAAGGQSNLNLGSIDFTRPGTASSILRASMAPNNFLQYSVDSPLLPSLDYTKIKSHLRNASDREKSLLLQALRWRLTRSNPGEQRDTVLLAFIDNDLFTCRKVFPQTANAGFEMLSLFESDDVAVRQYVARLYNTLSSLQQGRAYLSTEPESVGRLLRYMWIGQTAHNAIDHVFEEHLLGCLQKLSLRRPLQSVMIKGNLIRWLVSTLSEHETISDYMLEYAIALLMNLCLRSAGKKKCGEISSEVVKVLSDLLAHENREIRPYINGALYSVLGNPVVRESGRELGLEATLRAFMEDGNVEFNRQLEFIIQQLNKTGEQTFESDKPDSDDEGDEDDDEDQDAMEADLDKDEIVVARPNELSGEQLLNSNFLGIMTNSGLMPYSSNDEMGILQRPVTPSYKRLPTASSTTPQTQLMSPIPSSVYDQIEVLSIDQDKTSRTPTTPTPKSRSRSSHHRSGSNTARSETRPTTGTSRPVSRSNSRLRRSQQSNRQHSSRQSSQSNQSPNEEQTTPRTPRSGRSRQLPIDHEASILVNELTGLNRTLVPAASPSNPPSHKQKEFASAFGSRPRIPRTPDIKGATSRNKNQQPLSARGPPNPTFSLGEPQSRPNSGNSQGSSGKASSGSPGDSLRGRRTYH